MKHKSTTREYQNAWRKRPNVMHRKRYAQRLRRLWRRLGLAHLEARNMREILLAGICTAALAGCATNQPEVQTAPYSPHTRSYWTSVMGMADGVGERQTVLCRSDEYGRIADVQRDCFPGHNSGFWAGTMAGAGAGLMQGAGLAGGMAMLRPAVNNFSNNSTTSGGSVAPSAR